VTLTRARIVRGTGSAEAGPATLGVPPVVRDRVARERADAVREGEAIVADAAKRAAELLEGAAAQAAEAAALASREAELREEARFAAAWIALRAREEAAAEGVLERSVALAVVLAERIVGASIAADSSQIAALASQALAEAAGARRVAIEAHPLDAGALLAHIAVFAPLPVEVSENPELTRGSLLLHTDLGTLDAKLAPRIERLAAALAGALRK
jgi:hypothetical protein